MSTYCACGDEGGAAALGGSTRIRSFLFYYSPDSPYQHINPLTKMVVVVCLGAVAFMIENVYVELVLLAFVCLGLVMARIPGESLKMIATAMSGLLLIAALSHALFSQVPGRITLFTLPWGTYFTERTLLFIITFYLRFLTASLVSLVFLCTTRESDVVVALRFLRLPYVVCFAAAFTLRLISTLIEGWWALVEAQRVRGMEFSGSLLVRMRRLSELASPLLADVFTKIREVDLALQARGFTVQTVHRTQIRRLRWNIYDYTLLTLTSALFVAVAVARYAYGYLSFG
jgi:energy-coupling factor transporter transmembrane protein EcfT